MIRNPLLRRVLIFAALAFILSFAFVTRRSNFQNSKKRAIDEIVYVRMALQVQEDPKYYNTIPYGQQLAAAGRELPAYFFRPLFKHPPIFTLLLSLSFMIFGVSELSAVYVPLIFSLMLVPLTYFLGTLVYNRWVGFFAAVLVAFDPFLIVCSQKVWMETLIAFFVVATLYAFIRGLKTDTPRLFIASGVLSGLGALTKYTGGIGTVIVMLYAIIWDRRLFKNKYFLSSLIIPVLMLIPWIAWNIQVYGWEFFGMQINLHSDKHHAALVEKNLLLLAGSSVAFMFLAKRWKERRQALNNIRIATGCGLAVLLFDSIVKCFTITYLPETSWAGATFYGSARSFYLDRLLEFSIVPFFAFLSLFVLRKESLKKEEYVLRLAVIIIIMFYTAWGAFQSRYIIAVVPIIVLIGVDFLWRIFQGTSRIPSFLGRSLSRSVFFIVLWMIYFKLQHINHFISYPNDLCYF